jgi:hypothetical protein
MDARQIFNGALQAQNKNEGFKVKQELNSFGGVKLAWKDLPSPCCNTYLKL